MAKKPKPEENKENGAAAATEQQGPTLNALAQYVKDFSFENPRAPQSLQVQQTQPAINISVNVNANPMNETDYEVVLKLEADAKVGSDVLFNVELLYAGIFRITGLPQEQIHPVVFVECPRLLFPFARQIVAEGTRNGGFPPLMVDPVDFAALYKQQLTQLQAQQGEKTDA